MDAQAERESSESRPESVFKILEKMCRLCGKSNVRHDIFGEDELKDGLPAKVNNYLPGIDVRNNGLPSRICPPCLNLLNSWHNFYLKTMTVKNFFENLDGDLAECDDFIADFLNDIGAEKKGVKSRSKGTTKKVATIDIKEWEENMAQQLEQLSEEEREFLAKFKSAVVNGKNVFQCDRCSFTNCHPDVKTRLERFQKHYSDKHSGIRRFPCTVCPKAFPIKSTLTRHLSLIHNIGKQPEIHHCEVCQKSFRHKRHFAHHVKMHATNAENAEAYICDFCGRSFQHKSSLSAHIKKERGENERYSDGHPGIRRFPCTVCPKAFSQKNTLTRHLSLIHSIGKQPEIHYCEVCGKSFRHKRHFAHHVKMHTTNLENVEAYICDFCGKSFQYKSSLSMHVKREKGENNYVCTVCGNGFPGRKYLDEHMVKHSNERNYPCEVCGKMFKLPKYVISHMRETHSGEEYPCNECGARFKKYARLELHLAKKHGY